MKKNSPSQRHLLEQRFTTRRQFLAGSRNLMLSLPFLPSLLPQFAMAQSQSKKIRYICGLGYLGIDYHQWVPGEQSDMIPIANSDGMHFKPLSSFAGQISRVIDRSFTDLYSEMNIISGLSLTGGNYQGHNESVLSGTHSGFRTPIFGKSIDVIIEQSPAVYTSNDVVARKAIRMHDRDHLKGFSFDRIGGNRVISAQLQGDVAMFNALLGGLTGGSSGPSPDQQNKIMIVDQVRQDLATLERHPRLSKADKEMLDLYITSIHDLQRKVAANNQMTCEKPTIPFQVTRTGNYWHFPNSGWGVLSRNAMYDNYIQIMKVAALCDQTRVFHWALASWDSDIVPGGTEGDLHHEAPSSDIQADRQQFFIKKLADLARVFRSTPDPINGEGNLLDNSIIFYANELGDWTTGHSTFNMPTITFGGGGGRLEKGNYIDCRQRPVRLLWGNYPGRPYKQFLQAVMATMGVPKSEYMQFGDGNGFGEFKAVVNQFGKNQDVFGRYAAVHNDPLPFFFKG
jgi:hypothetical protein